MSRRPGSTGVSKAGSRGLATSGRRAARRCSSLRTILASPLKGGPAPGGRPGADARGPSHCTNGSSHGGVSRRWDSSRPHWWSCRSPSPCRARLSAPPRWPTPWPRVAASRNRSLNWGPMSFAAESFAAHLARAVDLFRDPEKKEDQKRVFRALVAMLQGQSVTVRVVGGRISVNGAPIDGPQLGPLLQRLELHGVGEMTIPQDAPVSQVFALLRALADQPAWSEDIDARLRASGASHVSVSIARLTDPPSPPPPRGERPPAAAPRLDGIASPPPPGLGTADFHNSSPMPVMPAPGGSNDALEVLATLESQPHGAGVGDTLAALVRQAGGAGKAGQNAHPLGGRWGTPRAAQPSLPGG